MKHIQQIISVQNFTKGKQFNLKDTNELIYKTAVETQT